MTIDKAVTQMIESDAFQEKARTDANYRMFVKRFRDGRMGEGSAIAMLNKFGYRVEAVKTKKKVPA